MYILKCIDDSFYVGLTNNLERRLYEHRQGFGSRYTSARLPITFEYSETFKNRNDAERREEQLKKWSRVKKEALIYGNIENLKEFSKPKS